MVTNSTDMKKTYIKPALQANEAQVINIMAVSLQDGYADPSQESLGKEDNAWDLWSNEEQ